GWLTQSIDWEGISTFYEYMKNGGHVPLFQGNYGRMIKTTTFDPMPVKILRGNIFPLCCKIVMPAGYGWMDGKKC
ncbi:MAG: hypothetical protein LBD30_00435, partial [Verrucomicrobiales bacterium]|nr:hypothetical protein [Verrucomicrobiales bacterium]